MGKTIGFIGCGNMAKAMISGIVTSDEYDAKQVMASDPSQAQLDAAKAAYGISVSTSNKEVVEASDILVLAVKPQYSEAVTNEISSFVKKETIVISIAPGKTVAWLGNQLGADKKIFRAMPNTPAMVGEGMMGLCPNENVTEEEKAEIVKLCSCFGKASIVTENLMDVVTAVSGSSPAYVFMFIEAMADAAVCGGMPRAQAYEFAAQAVLGSAKMVLETGKHPGELKDMVCSPAGTTIEAVKVLEEMGLRAAVMDAMEACLEKSRSM